jgi:hypothetical protein
MTHISITSKSPAIVLPLLNEALEREKGIIKHSMAKCQSRVSALSAALGVDAEKLMAGEVPHTEENEMELLELAGEIELLRHFAEEIAALETVEICAA